MSWLENAQASDEGLSGVERSEKPKDVVVGNSSEGADCSALIGLLWRNLDQMISDEMLDKDHVLLYKDDIWTGDKIEVWGL
jgi:hypothetical protein